MVITLYDLAGAEDSIRFSPHCWRVRMALRHKGLDFEAIPWRFTEKDVIAFSGQGAVPVLVDGQRTVVDSWEIARYLDAAYPDSPSLLGGEQGTAHALFIKLWCEQTLHPLVLRMILFDIFAALHEKDIDYFRRTREARLGMTLEQAVLPPEQGLPQLAQVLSVPRAVLAVQPYLGGISPSFADYLLLGVFMWARTVSPIRLLQADDPMYAWRERLLDAFDGYARKARRIHDSYPE